MLVLPTVGTFGSSAQHTNHYTTKATQAALLLVTFICGLFYDAVSSSDNKHGITMNE
jgi:hypothetical protein